MPSFPRLEAVEFRRELDTGATKPCIFACEDEFGNSSDHVTKFRSEVRGSGLVFEYVAARLAYHFQIPIPEPALIMLSLDLAMTQRHNTAIRDKIIRNVGLNFGTRYLVGLTAWPTERNIPGHLRPVATNVLAFDALIDNADRRRAKPNLLAGSECLFVIDHELAFGFLRLIGTQTLWRERLRFLRDHPLFYGLCGTPLDLRFFADRLQELTDAVIDEICDQVPSDFGHEHLQAIKNHLRFVREDARDFLNGLMEVVAR